MCKTIICEFYSVCPDILQENIIWENLELEIWPKLNLLEYIIGIFLNYSRHVLILFSISG